MDRRALWTVLSSLALPLLLSCARSSPDRGDAAAPGAQVPQGAAGPKRLKIAVVPKGTTHEFWKSVHAGAAKAAKELDVDIVWKGPLKEDDLKAQVDVVGTFIAQGVSGIVIAPLNDAALRAPVKQAKDASIPVVVFDSDLQGNDHVSFVATDNRAAGKMAADAMSGILGGKGRVVMLRYQEGSASTQNRERGFSEGLATKADLKIVSEIQYAGPTTESAFAKAESLLLAQRAGAGGVDGVFTPNESTTFGMLLAMRKSNLQRKMKFVGFDASDKLVAALRDGDIDALVVQNPFNMGYLAVKTMADHLRGRPVEARIDTGAVLVKKENLDDPKIAEVLRPDIGKWLAE